MNQDEEVGAVDTGALATSVGQDLFGGAPQVVNDGQDTPLGAASPAAQPATPAPGVQPTPAATPGRPLPKAWKKDTEPLWTKADPALQEYIHAREDDVLRGIGMYKQAADSWNGLLAPYQEILSQRPDVNPQVLFQNLLHNHLALLSAGPEQKRELAMRLLQEYQVDLGQGTSGAPAAPAIPPELVNRIGGLENNMREMAIAAQMPTISAFFADPKNEFAEELGGDIVQLLQSGQATTLPDAYEKAKWTNPAVRQKLFDRQMAERLEAERKESEKNRRLARLNGTPAGGEGGATPTGRVGTMEDTINGVVAKHYQKH